MTDVSRAAALELLKTYRVDGSCLYMVGTFDTGVTVFSQQVRALNLAWSAIESELLPASISADKNSSTKRKKIAIVGAGFAGLSVAASLLAKGVLAELTLFEQRDALLPLQQGSDSRWLHPRIYDWPKTGSQASVAMLPILNWTAARASDVVVQVLAQWGKIVHASSNDSVRLYCNARHLQIHETPRPGKRLRIEWVGEERDPADGAAHKGRISLATGMSDDFDMVILAVGFGLERDGVLSYWRNETVGQPSLDEPRRTYLVSGQGDGAMIDLLRVRISQYRQDRILEEVFAGHDQLLFAVQALHQKFAYDLHKAGLFGAFEALGTKSKTKVEFESACERLRRRLRRDTDVILRLQVKKLSQLFDPKTSRISFQNKLLVYMLYKCGGFVPSTFDEKKLVQQHGIPESLVIRRHGTYRDEQLEDMLSETLYQAIQMRRGTARPDPFSQIDRPCWPGGYFDTPGPSKEIGKIGDDQRSHWRKEYLPGPTEMLATAFCSAIAGAILVRHSKGRLRVTIHRAMVFGSEELLQQACDYQGTKDARAQQSAAGRTFPAENGTIGQAYCCRQIVRSIRDIDSTKLNASMEPLKLHEASRLMSKKVGFVLAIPLLEPESRSSHTAPSPVLGVIYIDSTAPKFFIDDKELKQIVAMTESFLEALQRAAIAPVDRIRNIQLAELADTTKPAQKLSNKVKNVLELVTTIDPPRVDIPLQLNFDHSDFIPIHSTDTK
ncbi:FAD dependent oxidoreductase [Variovorax sp. YR266]|uniref:FAD-dependent oxidoreductase n=1 Tax=Variovorax sp. YR266 TaxID=1884386 RepID=UPI00089B373D|nr:FAD-dependent oxidoreductase [Variovorax sp. YR266]SDZ64567.1 FAD dependent oxidoreductase [Variovorax sp. YR266]